MVAVFIHAPPCLPAVSKASKPGTKRHELIRYLATGARINRFIAERRPLHDHVLNTSIANLAMETGIVADREWIVIPAVGGTKTVRVKQYWLTGEHLTVARKLMGAQA
jgi:hypothetical protein